MIKNYLKIAFRNFWRHKMFTMINIVGLSIGISASIVIYLIVQYDFTFDNFHKDGDRIYRVTTKYTYQGLPAFNPGVCGPMFGAVKTDVSGIDIAAAILRLSQPNVLIPGEKMVEAKFKLQDNVILADENYFKLFQYKWLAGSAGTSLNAPFQVVLTSEQAKLYFPGLSYQKMMGKLVVYDAIRAQVTGIVETVTQNTDFVFHDFISYSTAMASELKPMLRLHNWGGTNVRAQLFVKLSPQMATTRVEQQLNAILKKNYQAGPEQKGNTHTFLLQPLNDIHFNENYGTFDSGRVASKTTLYELLVIALFLLLLGCINFVNLTTAQSVQRAKEIGIRKTMGSSRKQLIIQFLSETFFLTLVAVLISVAMAHDILKLFAGFIPAGVGVNFIAQPGVLLFLVGLTIVVSLLSGFYPALILSGYKPALVLKNQAQSNSSKTRNTRLRKSLTVTQFVIAQFFIMATILVSKQIYYALHKDLGFKKDAIVIVNSPLKNRNANSNRVFMDKLHTIPQVDMVSAGRDAPTSGDAQATEGTYKDGKKEIKIENLSEKFGDENYIKLYHIKLLAGRNLMAADTGGSFLINESLAKRIGFRDPHDAVGKQISNFNGDRDYKIIGVVADFHQESIHEAIAPLAIIATTDPANNGTFHIALKPESSNGNDWKKAISSMEASWKEIYPEDDFEYHFFDESIAQLYDNERRTTTLLNWAAGLSILISCLGLLGLAIYTTNQRKKEIGVRKVLGATITQVVALLSTELVALILIAFVIVTPVAWFAMNKWIQNFADRTAISWWIFAVSGGAMLLTALFTSSFQTLKAASANPVKSLRSE